MGLLAELSSESAICHLYQGIVVRALKDYLYPQYKKQIIDWVLNEEGSFYLCAEAMGLKENDLKAKMVDKMIVIDTLGTAHLFTNGLSVRFRV